MSTTPNSPPPRQPPSTTDLITQNPDLLTEILTHIPTKPLLPFKLISKHFLSLISSSHFSLLHSHRHTHHPATALFFLHHHHHHLSSSFDFIPLSPSSFSSTPPFFSVLKSSNIDILQSCNGLLLCSSSRVFNPTINQMLSFTPPRSSYMGLTLCFDPSRSHRLTLICVWRVKNGENDEESDNLFAIDVFSSGSNLWRPVVCCFKAPFDVEFDRGVYFDNGVYWLSHTDSTVMFDLGNECVEDLCLPNPVHGAYLERFRYFGESCGHLHLIEIRTNCVSEFDVLELDRREKKEWFVKFRVDLDVVGRGFESQMFQDHSDRFHRQLRFYAFSVLAVIRGNCGDDDDGESDMVVSVPGKVISYNFKSKVSKLIANVVDESDRWLPFKGYNAYQFIESLYPLC